MICCGEEVDALKVFPSSQITPDGLSDRDFQCPSFPGFGLGYDLCAGTAGLALKAPVRVGQRSRFIIVWSARTYSTDVRTGH